MIRSRWDWIILIICIVVLCIPASAYIPPHSAIPLYPGWNFVSFPYDIAEGKNTVEDVFIGVDTENRSIFEYNSTTKIWQILSPDSILRSQEGIWIYSRGKVWIEYDCNTDRPIPPKYLESGWNGIGFSIVESTSVKDALSSLDDRWMSCIGFDASVQRYLPPIINNGNEKRGEAQAVSPYGGYWLLLSSPGVLESLIEPNRNLTVSFIDVGYGDSIFIEMPAGTSFLIDAGNESKGEIVETYLRARGIREFNEIYTLIPSTPRAEHYGGFRTLLGTIPVKSFCRSTFLEMPPDYENFTRNITIETGCYFDPRILDPEVRIDMISPRSVGYNTGEDVTIIRLTYKQSSFLFMSDAGFESEHALIEILGDVDVDILKVGNHGDRKSSGTRFLSKVSPVYSVITVGADNPYGHPAPETLERLRDAGSEIYRTDRNGTIIFSTNGYGYMITTEK